MPRAPDGRYYCNCSEQCGGSWQERSRRTHTRHAPYRRAGSAISFTHFLETLLPEAPGESRRISQARDAGTLSANRTSGPLLRAGHAQRPARPSLTDSVPIRSAHGTAARLANPMIAIPTTGPTAGALCNEAGFESPAPTIAEPPLGNNQRPASDLGSPMNEVRPEALCNTDSPSRLVSPEPSLPTMIPVHDSPMLRPPVESRTDFSGVAHAGDLTTSAPDEELDDSNLKS